MAKTKQGSIEPGKNPTMCKQSSAVQAALPFLLPRCDAVWAFPCCPKGRITAVCTLGVTRKSGLAWVTCHTKSTTSCANNRHTTKESHNSLIPDLILRSCDEVNSIVSSCLMGLDTGQENSKWRARFISIAALFKQYGNESPAITLVSCGRPKIREGTVIEVLGKNNKLQDAMRPTVSILTRDRIYLITV